MSKSVITRFSPAVILLCSVPPKQLKRWIFRYLQTVSPFLFKTKEVLYDLSETLSMTEPQTIFVFKSFASFLKKSIVSPPSSSSGKFLKAHGKFLSRKIQAKERGLFLLPQAFRILCSSYNFCRRILVEIGSL